MSELLKQDSQNPYKLYMDTEIENQPEGTYPFALNALDDSEDGSKGAKVNEIGNIECLNIESDLKGWIKIDEKAIALFVGDDTIGVFNPLDCSYYKHVIPGLNLGKVIKGTSRIINGCEKVIYFEDADNPDRYFNLDRIDDFKTNNNWDLNSFEFLPDIKYPVITATVQTSGGSLEYGTYFFVLELLDSNQNVRYISLPQGRSEISKGLNLEYSPSVGGKPKTNNSIELNIKNLDTSFVFYRLNVLIARGNNDSLVAYQIGTLNTISDTTDTVVISEITPDKGDFLIDKNSILQNTTTYSQSRVITQAANVLLRANLKEHYKDYSTYQRFASKIKTEYVVRLYDKDKISSNLFTEQGDEVKAYFIHYLDNKGQISPAFHIPGRPKELGDDDIISFNNTNLPKWKLQNTANTINKLGYYEVPNKYERPINLCDDSLDYWGVDYAGNVLEGTNIRHHKIPDRNKVPIERNNQIQYIGVTFTNIEYPDSSIVGHFFSSVSAKEVVASGLTTKFRNRPDYGEQGKYLDNFAFGNPTLSNFICYESLINNRLTTANHMAVVANYSYQIVLDEESEVVATISNDRKRYDKFFNDDLPYEDLYLYFEGRNATGFTPNNSITYTKINDARFLLPQTQDSLKSWYNRSLSASFNILQTQDGVNTFQLVQYAHLKNFSSKLDNLESLIPRMLHDEPYTSTDVTDTFFIFGGDSRISTTPITNIAWTSFDFGFFFEDDVKIVQEYFTNFYIESPIDASLRLDTTNSCNSFLTGDIIDYTINKTCEIINTGTKTGYKLRDSICKEWYGYNKDYNLLNSFKNYKPLRKTYNYCSKCLNHYPERIIYSEVGTNEDSSDSFLNFKPLNYVDLPANSGEIIDINFKTNQLLVRTKNACFIFPLNFQTIQTDGNTTYLGTGSFLSISPTELNSSQIGFGGQQDKLASCDTPYGLYWIDNTKGTLFSFDSGIKEISLEGMYHFLRNELPSIKPFGLDVSKTELAYDDRFKRLIISKKDYEPTDKLKDLAEFVEVRAGDFLLFGSKIYTDNKEWFVNKSFTLSFDLLSRSFKTFHSYLPDRMLFSETNFFTTFDNKIWVHNKGKRCHYYNTSYPYIIEFVVRNLNTFFTHALHYFSTAYLYVPEHKIYKQIDNTFDQMVVYSDFQSTGIVNLILMNNEFDNINFSNFDKFVIKTDQNYKIAQIRDIATDTPVFTKSWNELQDFFINGQGYMDKDFINVDYTKAQYELSDIKSKAVRVRLILNNSDIKLVTHLMQTYQFYSAR